ncbi:immunoglobulin domain-containing protein [Luteolibacter arcticus]|uniref:Immunoglobulin domain-containing protein n=1 Tax=Luteolibacter arcticus TaxID=1581411 RepID=A0ABT3GSN2_9BACT|nr:immunoglobulin domain-containing protein [Luteolibacter arcticus]MCW1926501.1 immunoglobulin domain-containing protein [Luteolibacter arcticus]
MKRPYPYIFRNCALILAGWLAPLGSQAAQMAYEGFDYSTGTGNLTGLSGGFGWNGNWQTVNNGSADIVAASLAAGASSPSGYDALSTGNSCLLPNDRRVGRLLNTSTNGPFGARGFRDGNGRIGADGTTLYLSFMQRPNGTGSYYEFEFHRDNLGDGGRIGGIGNDQGGANVHLRAPNGTHTFIGAGNTNVNFYVVRIDFKAGNDDVYVYQNPTSATEPAPTLMKLAAADMSFNGVSFGAFGGGGRTVAHDEVRFGQTWTDVTIPTLAQAVFVTQPRASTTVFTGGSVSLSAVANAYPPPTYQWYHGVILLSGQTSSTLTLNNVQPGDAGDYHVVATNSQGAVPSGNGTVVVLTTPPGLLAYEGFDYDTGASNMNGKAGGLGWGAAWTPVDGGGGNVQSGNLAAGTNAPNGYDAQSLANSSFIPNNKRDGRLLDTTPGGRFGSAGYVDTNGNIGADSKTLYLSFLQQPDGTSFFYEFEFHRGNLGDPGRIAGIGNDTGGAVVNLRTPLNTPTFIGPGSTGVNFYVVRIDFKAGDDEIRIYQNPLSATEPATATVLKTNGGDLSFNGLSVAAFVNGRTVKHDEIRLGQNWSDVVFGTSRRNLTWVGDGTTNAWDFATNNWNDGVAATAFADGDPVTFNDNGSAAPAVNVTTNVATASLTVDNSTNNYTFGGTGSIASSGGLHKLGSASLTLTAPASFGSSVLLDAGDVALNGTSTASGNLVLGAGSGTLTLGGNNAFNGSLLDSGFGDRVFSGTNTFTGLSTSSGNLTFSGTTNFTGSGAVLFFGNLAGANASVTIEPGAVINITGAYNDAWVVGRDGGTASVVQNGGTVTYNPSNRGEAFIGASGNNTGTAPTYEMKGGILDMSNKRLGIALGGSAAGVTAVFTQTGGSVLVRQLDLGANLAFGDATYTLESGTLTIGAGGITTATGSTELYTLDLGGGTVIAADNWNSTLEMTLTDINGDTTFDTAAHAVRLSGAIDGTGGLVKNGTGALTLTGLNTYGGPTQVNAGTLGGARTSDNSPLTVASGATLAPGDLFTDTFAAPSAVLASGSTFHVKIDNDLDAADQLQTIGATTITGANLTFSEIGAGVVPSGTQVVIVDALGGLTGTFAGLPEGSPVDSGVNTFTIHYSATQVTLTSTSVDNPYVTWATTNGLDGIDGRDPAFEADPDFDGIANGLEWVLGGDPLASDSSALYAATGDATSGITLEFDREETSLGAATLLVQWNTDLGITWTDVPIEAAGGTYANGVTVSIDTEATPDHVTVNIPASNGPGGKLFARIAVTAIAP